MEEEKIDDAISRDEQQAQENPHENNQEEEIKEQEDYEQKYHELKNEYLRVFADFENSKKRLERDKFQALEYAYEKFAKDLLPIIDALQNAKEASKQDSAILEGITLTLDSLTKTLAKYGIEEIDSNGEFDPNLHDCIMQVPNEDLEDGKIAQVMQRGYKYKERTLRPAMVAIVKN